MPGTRIDRIRTTLPSAPAITGNYYAYGIAEFEDPVRSGYKFDGWYKDEQYSEKFIFINNTNDVMGGYDRVYEDITLYAKWEKSSKEEQEAPSQTEKPTETEKPTQTEKPAEKPTQTEKPAEKHCCWQCRS